MEQYPEMTIEEIRHCCPESPTDIPTNPQAVTDELLRNVTRRIVDALAPEQVILFGSYAEGRATADSDLDLLVITGRPVSREERRLRTQGLFRDMPLPIQVITISQQEFEETRDVIGGIAYPAARYGRIIYAKS
jgi:predicted nucleotidyltransferase